MNTTALIIAILDYSEIDTEVSGTGVEIMESHNCREVLGDSRDTNGVLAMMKESKIFL